MGGPEHRQGEERDMFADDTAIEGVSAGARRHAFSDRTAVFMTITVLYQGSEVVWGCSCESKSDAPVSEGRSGTLKTIYGYLLEHGQDEETMR